MSPTFGRASQRAFDTVLILSVVCVVAYTGWHIVAASQVFRRLADLPGPNRYRTGDQLPLIDGIASNSRNTVAVVLSSGCKFCAMSAPFYRDLIQRYGRSSRTTPVTQVVAICQESLDSCRPYLDRERLVFDAVVSAIDTPMKLVDTPTLLLLDQSRHVRRAWVGYQDQGGRTAITDVLRSSIGLVPR